MLMAMLNEFASNMTFMSITNKYSCLTIDFMACCWFKTVSQPLQPMYIAHPPLYITGKCPTFMNVCRNPCRGQVFTLKNDERWNRRSICTKTFHDQYPLLSTRLCLIFCSKLFVDNYTSCCNFADGKTTLIHIVDIRYINIMFIENFAHIVKPL